MRKKKTSDVEGGQVYWRPYGGRLKAMDPAYAGDVDVWICRRVADFPHQQVPAGAKVAACTKCEAAIVFNPARTVSAPKVCMQCASIRPLPIEDVNENG